MILPGTVIGNNHVSVAANSVVSGIIPDYSVVVGAPAIVVKRYDETSKTWRKTNKEGSFV